LTKIADYDFDSPTIEKMESTKQIDIVILIGFMTIDDHADTNEAVNDYCKMRGISCKVASRGQQGLFEIQKRDYDLIL
jgi:hypothetical protein